MPAPRIGFIGAGNMAASLIGGLIAKGLPSANVLASDPNTAALNALVQQHSITGCPDNQAVAQEADLLVLAIKPQVMKPVLQELVSAVARRRPLIISIAAGIRIHSLCEWLGDTTLPVVRCMPNTPALLQLGASGLFANAAVSQAQRQQAESTLAAVGTVTWLADEAQIDAVTALSGSGPAYFFLLMEAMIEAGQRLGLDAEAARLLTLQTALGAASMAMASDVDPAELRRRVTSPGGTTERAVAHFEQAGLRQIVADALSAAALRSQELSDTLG